MSTRRLAKRSISRGGRTFPRQGDRPACLRRLIEVVFDEAQDLAWLGMNAVAAKPAHGNRRRYRHKTVARLIGAQVEALVNAAESVRVAMRHVFLVHENAE